MHTKTSRFLFKFFMFPIILTSVSWRHEDLSTFREIATTFCIYFTLNWFFAVTVLEWNDKRADKFNQEKKAKKEAKKKEQKQES